MSKKICFLVLAISNADGNGLRDFEYNNREIEGGSFNTKIWNLIHKRRYYSFHV